jgi:hypothetical protein
MAEPTFTAVKNVNSGSMKAELSTIASNMHSTNVKETWKAAKNIRRVTTTKGAGMGTMKMNIVDMKASMIMS